MSTLVDLLAEHTTLSDSAAGHLQRLVAEWQLLADLSFADFVLSVRTDTGEIVNVAQCRPNTASTVFPSDEVGTVVDPAVHPQVARAFAEGRILRDEDPTWLGAMAIRRETVPVRFVDPAGDERIVGVLTRAVDLTHPRLPSPLELAYQDSANDLCQMVADGTFPQYEGNPQGLSTPRAGDGFVRIDARGMVVYSSPNALSAFHRMGWTSDLSGARLSEVTATLLTDPFESQDAAVMIDAACGISDPPAGPYRDIGMRMEADARSATVLIRAVALRPRGVSSGAVVLIRDVTEVKRRDLALISKDATIREIHHRVKNNLQSVSALLRLQARRTTNDEARTALTEAVRRVASIALVHELLSGSVDEEVDLDEAVDRLVPTLVDVASGEQPVMVRRRDRLGVLASDLAMPLVMVLTELVQNAIEHGFAPSRTDARIDIHADRDVRRLRIAVRDNGSGLPDGFDLAASERLGLRIVQTLVSIELGGEVRAGANPDGPGAEVVLVVPLRREPR
ncbi:putative two-component histidine kinase [Gordonia polyisoprenivorans NBRC 16320 = JCM 10675]|uniref:histidine kinase n=1 Tax=Gordonia polyisoprenivorans TaxID=84595 RepID=A0A846WWE9_9ACTN|nr:sensor histidine kinase [Gordonia polyisoprenivorans]MBE7194157.1 sensor histidine kinase [Gordonia polyisoprenivorans]NKY05226.1 ATPase [Gordonia polyisoprenivorans]UZF54782.1 sensor histidine kinase [Gordonia polyisoprenivorans]GAB22055.1 putative two-component histidine kinase [Gordonia polyisoprenivorans NBRC 16320 = JCM 10675]